MAHWSCILLLCLFAVVAIRGVPLDYQEKSGDSMDSAEDEVIFDRRDRVSAPPIPAIPEIPSIPGYEDHGHYGDHGRYEDDDYHHSQDHGHYGDHGRYEDDDHHHSHHHHHNDNDNDNHDD